MDSFCDVRRFSPAYTSANLGQQLAFRPIVDNLETALLEH